MGSVGAVVLQMELVKAVAKMLAIVSGTEPNATTELANASAMTAAAAAGAAESTGVAGIAVGGIVVAADSAVVNNSLVLVPGAVWAPVQKQGEGKGWDR